MINAKNFNGHIAALYMLLKDLLLYFTMKINNKDMDCNMSIIQKI